MADRRSLRWVAILFAFCLVFEVRFTVESIREQLHATEQAQIPFSIKTPGATIYRLEPEAIAAGILKGDLPVSIDGRPVRGMTGVATAVRHRIPLTVVVFADGAFGNVSRIQQEQFGNRLIACDLTNPDFVRFAESFGAAAERARNPDELRAALRRAISRRDGPTLIEVPVGPMPSPWEFIMLPKVRGQ